MSIILSAAHALPAYVLPQQQVKLLVEQIFKDMVSNLPELLAVFDNAQIETRQFVMPPEWYLTSHNSAECNQVYLEKGLEMMQQSAEKCLRQAGLSVDDIDHIIFVSSTGHATPSLDARLINSMGFSADTTRLPIWGLGCAAGAAGLARAHDYCQAYPQARVLLVAMECCSLTLRSDDLTPKNVVGTALFGDGAAAAIVAGEAAAAQGPRILTRQSHLFPDTERIMGWDFDDRGMQLVLSQQLPQLVHTVLPDLVKNFLESQGLKQADIKHYITHPGGARVIDAYQAALGLHDQELALSKKSLRDHGNISSVSVMMILEAWLAANPQAQSGYGLLSAFGPGFSAEMLLLEL